MFKVTFRFESGEPVEAFAAAEENLLEVARKTNVAIDAPCSGNGSCGKCKVKLLKGTWILQEQDISPRKSMQKGGDCLAARQNRERYRSGSRILHLHTAAE